MKEKLTIKPSVRLLKMLGEDLIKDEKTALIELIKNSYDADATCVTLNFKDFGDNFSLTSKSQIVIEDNGEGMTSRIIKEEWLNPATSYKKSKKNSNTKTKKGRVLQGEKGIGRFAMFKLGRTIELQTKHENEVKEFRTTVDLSSYNNDYIVAPEDNKAQYLEDMEVILSESDISTFDKEEIFSQGDKLKKSGTGTRLIISNLLGTWTAKKVKEVYFDIAALQSVSPIINGWEKSSRLEDFNQGTREFTVFFYKDGSETSHKTEYESNLTQLLSIIKEKSFLEVKNGYFDDKERKFSYKINNEKKSINITDPMIKRLSVYKRYFVDDRENFEDDIIECGPFSFEFYIFLLDRKVYNKIDSEKYKLSDEERDTLKKHRIYLYRDAIRVYPYGEPKDDWLQTDTLRGIFRANETFSNDQVVGLIKITYLENPKLQDKTNREGLIENGEATNEITALLQTFLSYLRVNEYSNYLYQMENNKKQEQKKQEDKERQKREEEQEKQNEEEQKKREDEQKKLDEEKQKKCEGAQQKQDEGYQNKREDKQKKQDEEANGFEVFEAEIDMRNRERNLFFKRSDVLKSSIESSPFYLNHNELIEQLSSLKYEKHYLLFVLSFRVLVENTVKKYLVSCTDKDLRKGLGENVNLMVEDILATVKTLDITQQKTLYGMLGGSDPFKNNLVSIKDEFYKNGKQESLANRLNSLTHMPIRMEEVDAVNIANNKILPLIIISEKIMEFLKSDINKK